MRETKQEILYEKGKLKRRSDFYLLLGAVRNKNPPSTPFSSPKRLQQRRVLDSDSIKIKRKPDSESMASGFNGGDPRGSFRYGVGSTAQFPYQQRSDGAQLPYLYQQRSNGPQLPYQRQSEDPQGVLKRSLSELEWKQQQQFQSAMFLRSVKPRTNLNSPISPLSPVDFPSNSSSSSISSSTGFNYLRAQPHPQLQPSDFSFVTPFEKKPTMENQLQELEKHLLFDDFENENEDDVSVGTDFDEAIRQLLSPSPPATTAAVPPQNSCSPLSPTTPTTSSTSSSSSSPSPNPPTPSKQLLLDTATAISDGNLDTATANLAVLKRSANPRGDSEQRLTAMMAAALFSRANPPPAVSGTLTSPIAELCSLEHQSASQMLYEVSPCFKHGLAAANYAILDVTEGRSEIHVVDFDFGQGEQYASLISALAERSRHRPSVVTPSVKITAVCDPTFPFNTISTVNNLKVIGEKITMLANRFNLKVRFNLLSRKVSDLDRSVLGCEKDDTLVVNFAFVLSRIADESVSPVNPRDELLRRVKSLEPTVVTVVEQEMNGNTAPFTTRFSEACNYYGSVLDSLDATMQLDNPQRVRVENCIARKAANLVAREGADRMERPEVLGKWRARMSMAGFKPVIFGSGVTELVKLRFGLMKTNPGFTLKEETGFMGFGWKGRVLTVASAWC